MILIKIIISFPALGGAFSLQLRNCRVYLAREGVEVLDEDYFCTLPAQVLFVVAERDVIVKTGKSLLYVLFLYRSCRNQTDSDFV